MKRSAKEEAPSGFELLSAPQLCPRAIFPKRSLSCTRLFAGLPLTTTCERARLSQSLSPRARLSDKLEGFAVGRPGKASKIRYEGVSRSGIVLSAEVKCIGHV